MESQATYSNELHSKYRKFTFLSALYQKFYQRDQTSKISFFAKIFGELNSKIKVACMSKAGVSNLVHPMNVSACIPQEPLHPEGQLSVWRSKVTLNEEQAREIFKYKNHTTFPSPNSLSIFLANKYQVSSKAIRDIWNGRSWLGATSDLWNRENLPKKRNVGRPRGSKDRIPRSSKSGKTTESLCSLSVQKIAAVNLPTTKSVCPLGRMRLKTFDSDSLDSSAGSLEGCSSNLWSARSVISEEGDFGSIPGLRQLPGFHEIVEPATFALNAVLQPHFYPFSMWAMDSMRPVTHGFDRASIIDPASSALLTSTTFSPWTPPLLPLAALLAQAIRSNHCVLQSPRTFT